MASRNEIFLRVIELHAKGYTDTEIATMLNRTPARICAHRLKAGLPPNLPKEQREHERKVVELYKVGTPLDEIAKECNTTAAAVSKVARRHGVYVDHRRRPKAREEQIIDLWRKGYIDAETAKIVGVAKSTVASVREEVGLPANNSRYAKHDAEVTEMYNSGKTVQEIAELLGWGENAVCKSLKRMREREKVYEELKNGYDR